MQKCVVQYSLQERLLGICDLAASVEKKVNSSAEAQRTGFVQFPLALQRDLVTHLPPLLPFNAAVLELGCGIGSFTVMSRAAEFRSYGIDCNPHLIEAARDMRARCIDDDYVANDGECKFAVGNMHAGSSYEEYAQFVKETFAENPKRAFEAILPLESGDSNPYEALGISLYNVDLVYCYPYPEHMPFLCKFLAETTSAKTHFILPFYTEDYASLLPLTPCYTTSLAPGMFCPSVPASIYRRT